MILRPRQKTFVDNCCKALKKYRNTLGVANTGFGKTVALSAVTSRIIGNNGKKAAIIAHRDELTSQNSKTFLRMNPDIPISFFNANRKSWRGKVTFSMIQTLSQDRHLEKMPPVDLLVYDEAHHSASNSYMKLTERARELNPNVQILGVTATPERSDNKGLKDTFDNVADIVTIGEMVRAGHLVPPRAMVIDIGTQEALSRVKRTANDYDQSEVEAIQNTDINNNQIVAKWQELSADRPTTAFCATVQHAEDVCAAFREMNIEAEVVHGKMPINERRAILAAFDRGEIQVLTNPMILTEGWDCQICSSIMLLRTSSHKSTMIQMIGRGLRKVDPRRYPGVIKRDCLVLDFGISILTHGNLEADVKLKHSIAKDEITESRKKKCPDCMAEIPIQTMVCPLCGYEFRIEITEDGYFDEAAELRLIEIDLINRSPFKWVSLYPSDRVMIASSFDSWACVCSADGENWFAIGGHGRGTDLLTIANKISAVSSADDFMRQNETSRSAKKAADWMRFPASEKQVSHLRRFGCDASLMSKVEAAAHLTFQFNMNKIERLMGV